MKIECPGHASFLLTTSAGTRCVTDPFDPTAYDNMKYRRFKGTADVVTTSHEHSDHGAVGIVGGNPVIIKGDGKLRLPRSNSSASRRITTTITAERGARTPCSSSAPTACGSRTWAISGMC